MPAAPATPNTPSPTDGGTAYYTLLSWVSARATKFEIYLDTVNPPVARAVIGYYVGTSYVPTLLPSTTYYWKIVAVNDGGTATGPVWSFTTLAATAVLFRLAGSLVSARFGTLSISDVINAAPNTGTLRFDTVQPTGGEAIQIGLGTLDDDDLIFGGEIQSDEQTYTGTPEASTFYPVRLIDHTFTINKRRPFGTWVDVPATTIARAIVDRYAHGFTSDGIQDGLPAVSINFDGLDDFMSCMGRLATAISSSAGNGRADVTYWKDVILSNVPDTVDPPDPITLTNKPLNTPSPIKFTRDLSQLRTRVYGKGHGENVPADIAAGAVIVPLADASMFNPLGGQAIAATTSDGAQTQILDYITVHLGGGGSLVGPGQAPSSALVATLASGAGIEAGAHSWAYTWVTASGETTPSPLTSLTVGDSLGPPSGSLGLTVAPGTGLSTGLYHYAASFVTAIGETVPQTVQSTVSTIGQVDAPATGQIRDYLTTPGDQDNGTGGALGTGTYLYAITFYSGAGETIAGPTISRSIPLPSFGGRYTSLFVNNEVVAYPAGATGVRVYRTIVNGAQLKLLADLGGTPLLFSHYQYIDTAADAALGANVPTVPPPDGNQINVGSIPTGPSGVTQRRLYRTTVGGSQLKLVTTIADNVTASYTDSTPDGSLGANALTAGTSYVSQVALTGIALGPTGTTSRKVYRTTAGGAQLKLQQTIADNTSTAGVQDASPDASLGANAPTGDTSAITQVQGQVNAGSTSLLMASAGPFSSYGGWAILPAGQLVRYTGITGNTLTGIPASGIGSIVTTVLYGDQVLPSPALVGINQWNGITLPMLRGSSVNIWVQRNDFTAQAVLGALERDENGNPTDGIREYTITDGRFGEDLLIATCDADLAQFSRPIIGAEYYTRDPKSKSGKTVSIDLTVDLPVPLTTWGLTGDFTIQSVDISFTGPAQMPLYHVRASSVAFTLSDLLRRVVIGS